MKYIKRLNIKKIFEAYSNIEEFHWNSIEEAKEIISRILDSMDIQSTISEDILQFELDNYTYSMDKFKAQKI